MKINKDWRNKQLTYALLARVKVRQGCSTQQQHMFEENNVNDRENQTKTKMYNNNNDVCRCRSLVDHFPLFSFLKNE